MNGKRFVIYALRNYEEIAYTIVLKSNKIILIVRMVGS